LNKSKGEQNLTKKHTTFCIDYYKSFTVTTTSVVLPSVSGDTSDGHIEAENLCITSRVLRTIQTAITPNQVPTRTSINQSRSNTELLLIIDLGMAF